MTIVEGVINVRHITGSESGVAMARQMLHDLLDRELPAGSNQQPDTDSQVASAPAEPVQTRNPCPCR
ncbi:MAG TPA: hypothetical protein VN541_08935 [Tepidisphaeraceae bacterium]|nr:hypothetical protein [Tepidisphaeraceae bacterium]